MSSANADCELFVASHVVRALAEQGIATVEAGQLVETPRLRTRDLALLGLGSLDWISLATRLEAETGVELPDHVLTEPEYRCVAGWAEALAARSRVFGTQDRRAD